MKTISKKPIIIYIWIITTFLLFCILLLNKEGIETITFIITTYILVFYYVFARYSCKITLGELKLYIRYTLPIHANVEIELTSIKSFDYKRGFLDFSASFDKSHHFKIIFFDTLYVTNEQGTKIINILTRVGGFKKVVKLLEENLKK